jgi:hypothetical protein
LSHCLNARAFPLDRRSTAEFRDAQDPHRLAQIVAAQPASIHDGDAILDAPYAPDVPQDLLQELL